MRKVDLVVLVSRTPSLIFLAKAFICRCVLDYFERDKKDNCQQSAFCIKIHVHKSACLFLKVSFVAAAKKASA